MSPWLLVWNPIHILLHEHLIIRIYYINVIDNSAAFLVFLDLMNVLLRSWIGGFLLILLHLTLLRLRCFKIIRLVFLVVVRVFHLII